MKGKERINWGIIAFIFVFCACLRLGMGLDLNKQTYPNNLNAYQEIMPLQRTVCVSDLLIPVFDMNDSINTVMFNDNPIIFDGDIR